MVSPLFLSLKVRIPFGPSYCPPSPPSPGELTLTLTVCLLFLLSLVVLHRAVAGSYAKGGVEREKKCVCVCTADFLAYVSSLPSKGGSWSWERAWHGYAGIGMCMHHRFNSTFLYFFFILFRTLSLFIAGGCLASWFGKFVQYVHMYSLYCSCFY